MAPLSSFSGATIGNAGCSVRSGSSLVVGWALKNVRGRIKGVVRELVALQISVYLFCVSLFYLVIYSVFRAMRLMRVLY